MTAPYTPQSWDRGPASDEYFRQLAAFNAQRDQFMSGLRSGLQPTSQLTQPTQSLMDTVPQAQVQQQAPWGDRDLIGAARFWGIPEEVAQAMPRHVLESQIEMLRQGARPEEDTFGNRIMAMAAVPGMLGVGMAEGVMNMATSLPLLGPALRRQQGVHKIDSYIRSLEEGFRASTPENFQGVLTGENVAGHLAALWHPGAAAWGLAGRGLTWVGNPIVRGALQGGASSYLLEGGGDHPGAAVAVGAALGPLAPLIGPAVQKISKHFVSPQMFESVEQELSHNVSPIMETQVGTSSDIALGRSLQMAAQSGDESAGALLESLQASGRVPRNLAAVRNPNFRSPGIPTAQAEGLATQLNKAETIIGSSELPRIAQQTQPTDVSVAEAAQVMNPGGTNLIEGVIDPAHLAANSPAPYISYVQRKGRLAAILSDEPITREVVDSFERHGMYPGQKAVHADQGAEVVIQSISPGGIATVKPLYGEGSYTVLTKALSPNTSSPGVKAVPELWNEFNAFADAQTMQTQIAMGGGLSPQQFETIRTTELPNMLEDFLDAKGIQGVGSRARIKQYFNDEHVKSFYPEAPAEAAWALGVRQESAAVANAHPASPVQNLDAAADSKGFLAVPNQHGGWSLVNRMAGPDGGIAGVGLDFADEDAAITWLQKLNRDMPDISPPSTVPGELGAYFREPQQLPNTNEVAPKALVQNLKEMEADAGVPLVPVSDNAAVASGNWGKMRNAWHKAAAFTPMRHRFASISGKVREIAGEDFGLAQDYDGLTNQLVKHHNEMNKPVNDLADILAPIDTKRLINGEWMRVWQIGEDDARMAAAQKLGWKPAEVNAMAKFSQLISDVAQEDVNPTLRSYINNVAAKQSVPELFNTAWDEPATANAINAWREHASTTNINLRELDPRVFGESFIRSVNWQRNMAPTYDAALAKWTEYAKLPGMENTAQFMKNWMGVMKQGYTADDDLALDMVHLAAQKMMGASFTRQQAKELVNFGMNTTHAAFLGYRVHVMARDALQLFFALPRAGPDLAKVIGKYTTDPAYRKMLWDTAMQEGAIQLQMPHRVSPGSLGGELESAAAGMAPEHMSKRMKLVGTIGAEIRDWIPDVLKGSSESVLKPLYLYGKQQELMRAMVYRAGFEKAERALLTYRQTGDLKGLMGESSARTFDPAWQEEFKRLVGTGDDQKAASFLGRQLADATQFKYGTSENPTVGRSLTGKLFMQFGSFQTQYVQYLRESLANGENVDKAKVALTFLGVTAGLEAASRESGWNFRLMNPFAIGFAGGPAIGMGIGMLQGAAATGTALFNPDQAGIDRGLAAGGQALGTLGSMLNPVSGLYNTASGLGSALNDSPMPGRAVGRLLLTGERGALPDILQSVHSADLVPSPNVVRQGSWQLPQVPQMQPVYPAGVPTPGNGGYERQPVVTPELSNPNSFRPSPSAPRPGEVPPDSILRDLGATDPTRVYWKNGALVYDSMNLGPDGRPSTYTLSEARNILAPGETWEQHEQRVMGLPGDSLQRGPVVRDISQLDSEMQNRVQAFRAFAAQKGVNLEVGETARGSQQQQAYWAQGRNPQVPGNVITWTLTSAHQGGKAIDFIVNGDRSGRDPGYAWMQEAAKQFGLVPLGPQDPGHLAGTDSAFAAMPTYPGMPRAQQQGRPPADPYGGSGAMF